MINRKELVKRHNPILTKINYESPLSVGNGELAFTADVTGMQSLAGEYEANGFPLCTMSQWGWHTKLVSATRDHYTFDDLQLTKYDYANRKVTYAVEEYPGNEEVYNWLRQNPHRLNLARIALLYEEAKIGAEQLKEIRQELHLYDGYLESEFTLEQAGCKVVTRCDAKQDEVSFDIVSELLSTGSMKIEIAFPYGSSQISGADWEARSSHTTVVCKEYQGGILLKRILDKDVYYARISGEANYDTSKLSEHKLIVSTTAKRLKLAVLFSEESLEEDIKSSIEPDETRTKTWWNRFWENGGIIELDKSKDPRARELERRVVLSQYLLAIQSSGSIPPQETGLTCNSWYGKFHLEMHLWHSAWMPLFKKDFLLERSIPWYKKHLPEAKRQARRNGFIGAKWPKMIAKEAQDSPSQIATLLIWQQPHIIYMLELLYRNKQTEDFLKEHWLLVKESADYMADWAHYEEENKKYNLISPVIPAQEEHDPRKTKNPTYELEYWKTGLEIASAWGKRLGKAGATRHWEEVAANLALPPQKDGLYLAHEKCPDTFEKYNKDHPSMLGGYGLLCSDRMTKKEVRATLNKVLECWEFDTMWGWDFALMAMTAVRLGEYDLAMDILMKDTAKNQYVTSGNNYQRLRTDLPLYLPGNGSLLLAMAMMTAGSGSEQENGFPKDGNWTVEYEGISRFIT